MSEDEVEQYVWHGIGIVCGTVSGGLVILDADTPKAVDLLEGIEERGSDWLPPFLPLFSPTPLEIINPILCKIGMACSILTA